MTKHLPAIVKHRKSFAVLSTNAASDTCIVFVHGFFGNPTTTWSYFAELCDEQHLPGADVFSRSDLYFYDYPAQKAFLKDSADELSTFLGRLFPKPAMDLLSLSHQDAPSVRSPWLPYSRLILVGHSLGAVVIRECIENQLRNFNRSSHAEWLSICEIHLFAAAHMGFKLSGWKGLLNFLLPVLTNLPSIWRAFGDLQPNSTALLDLRRRTEALAQTHPGLNCLKAFLVYGTKEDIVVPGDFDCDSPLSWLEGHDHCSLCKPTENFPEPLGLVTRDVHSETARA